MVNHGLSTGALFLLVGMLYDRRHTKKFEEFGGLAKTIPWFAVMLVFATLASVGLPALNGFVGEFMILIGAWQGGLRWATGIATFGVVLAAVYLLKMLQETIWGPITKDENRSLKDLNLREVADPAAALHPDALDRRRSGPLPRTEPAGVEHRALHLPRADGGRTSRGGDALVPAAASATAAPASTFAAGTPPAGSGSAR